MIGVWNIFIIIIIIIIIIILNHQLVIVGVFSRYYLLQNLLSWTLFCQIFY